MTESLKQTHWVGCCTGEMPLILLGLCVFVACWLRDFRPNGRVKNILTAVFYLQALFDPLLCLGVHVEKKKAVIVYA